MHTKLGLQSQTFKEGSQSLRMPNQEPKAKNSDPGTQRQKFKTKNPNSRCKNTSARPGPCRAESSESKARCPKQNFPRRDPTTGVQSQESNCENLGLTSNWGAGIQSRKLGAGNPKQGIRNLRPIARRLKIGCQTQESRAWNSKADAKNQESKNRNLTTGPPK